MKKMLIRDIKEWIKLIMNELRSNDEVEAIYLFGSYAKGYLYSYIKKPRDFTRLTREIRIIRE